jgi:hypothetical protein
LSWNLSSPPFIEGYPLPLAAGKLKLSQFAIHQLLVLLLESLAIPNSQLPPDPPNTTHQPLPHPIAHLSPLVMGYLVPSFTLNRKEWGSGLEILGDEDSHSAVVKPPKMKSFVVSTIVSVHPLLSDFLWKSLFFHPYVEAS